MAFVTPQTAGKRARICAILLAAFAAALAAQTRPDVDVQLEAATLERGRTSIVLVRVLIPDGRYIPAEDRGRRRGAWLRIDDGPFYDRELATFPIPDAVQLPGTDAPVLAYRGAIAIRLPLEVPPGVDGPQDLELQFGFELCSATACDAFEIRPLRQRAAVADGPSFAISLAFRLDASRLAILAHRDAPIDRALRFQQHGLPAFVMPIGALPATHPAARELAVLQTKTGTEWEVVSDGRRYLASANEPAAFDGGCEDIMPLAWIARVADPSFAGEPAKFFLAGEPDMHSPGTPIRRLRVPVTLTDRRRQDLERLIDRQRRVTLPSLFAPRPNPRTEIRRTAYDKRIDAGEGRLITHIEAFKLAPDDLPRLYVRAFWASGGVAQTGFTLWIRDDGERFHVERSIAAVSRAARFGEFRTFASNLAELPEYAGMLLNVAPGSDGWAYLVMGHRGYESMAVTVWKYSADGTRDTGIKYSHGC